MPRRIKVRILADGRVEAETEGIRGNACTPYIGMLENMLDAEAIESAYTPEYYESETATAETVTDSSINVETRG